MALTLTVSTNLIILILSLIDFGQTAPHDLSKTADACLCGMFISNTDIKVGEVPIGLPSKNDEKLFQDTVIMCRSFCYISWSAGNPPPNSACLLLPENDHQPIIEIRYKTPENPNFLSLKPFGNVVCCYYRQIVDCETGNKLDIVEYDYDYDI